MVKIRTLNVLAAVSTIVGTILSAVNLYIIFANDGIMDQTDANTKIVKQVEADLGPGNAPAAAEFPDLDTGRPTIAVGQENSGFIWLGKLNSHGEWSRVMIEDLLGRDVDTSWDKIAVGDQYITEVELSLRERELKDHESYRSIKRVGVLKRDSRIEILEPPYRHNRANSNGLFDVYARVRQLPDSD